MWRRLFLRLMPGRHRLSTAIILVVAALVMLSGFGKTIISVNDSFSKTERLAAISLLLTGMPERVLPVTFLDVDDATRKAWHAQAATPHAALAELIAIATESGARAILLDFDLSSDGGTPADPALEAALRNYPPAAPLLMLVRRIDLAAGKALPTSYDAAVGQRANIAWVTTLNDASSDRSVRRIRLWQTVCSGSSGTAYPSVALLTAGALLEQGRHADALRQFLSDQVSRECANIDPPPGPWPPAARQLVAIPFVLGDAPRTPALLRITVEGKPTVALMRIRAARLVKMEAAGPVRAGDIDAAPFAGRVTVIGGSYSDSGDIYATALGVMPGALVLANSVVQARTMVETVPPAAWTRNLLTLAVFLLFALAARVFVPLVALFIIGSASVVLLLALSRAFGFDTAFDVLAVALTGFGLFKLADAIVYLLADIPKRRWKAILKP